MCLVVQKKEGQESISRMKPEQPPTVTDSATDVLAEGSLRTVGRDGRDQVGDYLKGAVTALFPANMVREWRPLTERGLSNTKFRCTLDDGQSLLVRVNEKHDLGIAQARLEKMCFCSEFLRERGIPVPRILDAGSLPTRRPYSVEEWVAAGVPGDTIRGTEARCKVWQNLGCLARTWSGLDLNGAENRLFLGFDGDSPTESWEHHIAQLQPMIDRDQLLGFTDGQKAKLLARLQRFDTSCYPMALCHGDLKLDNVLVDPHTLAVTGVVDWEISRLAPRFLGEFSTSFEPAVLPNKQFAVARDAAEREAFAKGCGHSMPRIQEDFLVFYASEIFAAFDSYDRALASSRPDRAQLLERLDNYRHGIAQDLASIKALLA